MLAALWRLRLFRYLRGATAVCGVAGLAAAAGALGEAWVTSTAGVTPGALLLCTAYIGAKGQRSSLTEGSAAGGHQAIARASPI
ncbi:MAG TPA: hypothetical protein VMF65_25145 [Acidimicrobiales bacterium]|nr:hypothetical protein [Acidimicrobiales bacterium]